MNKKQIKEELRRSACEDEKPFNEVSHHGFNVAYKWKGTESHLMIELSVDDLRTFFLLVAEAM